MIKDAGKRPSLAPRNWSGWVLVAILWIIGKLPVRLGLASSRPLGWLLYSFMDRRKAVAHRNIERCFLEFEHGEVEKLVRANFRSLARTVFETGWSWGMGERRFERLCVIEGQEHLQAAQAAGRGVLLITSHMTCLEIGGRLCCGLAPVTGVYRPLGNEVIEWYQNRGRLRYAQAMVRQTGNAFCHSLPQKRGRPVVCA